MSGIQEPVSKKQDLMKLIQIGKVEKEVDILGNSVVMRVVDTEENDEALKKTSGYDIFTQQIIFKRATLAKALVKINGNPLPDEAASENFLGKLQQVVFDKFWIEYDVLRKYQAMLVENAEIEIKKSSRSQSQEHSGPSASSQSQTGSEKSSQSETKPDPLDTHG